MHAFLREIEKELKKVFLADEVEYILAFYSKEFERRMALKEEPMDIYRSIDMDEVYATWLPIMLKKRNKKNLKILFKSVIQLLTFMFKKQSFLPYAMITSIFLLSYLFFMIGAFYVMYLNFSIFYDYFIDILYANFETSDYLLTIGLGLSVSSFVLLITSIFMSFLISLVRVTIDLNINLIQPKGVTL